MTEENGNLKQLISELRQQIKDAENSGLEAEKNFENLEGNLRKKIEDYEREATELFRRIENLEIENEHLKDLLAQEQAMRGNQLRLESELIEKTKALERQMRSKGSIPSPGLRNSGSVNSRSGLNSSPSIQYMEADEDREDSDINEDGVREIHSNTKEAAEEDYERLLSPSLNEENQKEEMNQNAVKNLMDSQKGPTKEISKKAQAEPVKLNTNENENTKTKANENPKRPAVENTKMNPNQPMKTNEGVQQNQKPSSKQTLEKQQATGATRPRGTERGKLDKPSLEISLNEKIASRSIIKEEEQKSPDLKAQTQNKIPTVQTSATNPTKQAKEESSAPSKPSNGNKSPEKSHNKAPEKPHSKTTQTQTIAAPKVACSDKGVQTDEKIFWSPHKPTENKNIAENFQAKQQLNRNKEESSEMMKDRRYPSYNEKALKDPYEVTNVIKSIQKKRLNIATDRDNITKETDNRFSSWNDKSVNSDDSHEIKSAKSFKSAFTPLRGMVSADFSQSNLKGGSDLIYSKTEEDSGYLQPLSPLYKSPSQYQSPRYSYGSPLGRSPQKLRSLLNQTGEHSEKQHYQSGLSPKHAVDQPELTEETKEMLKEREMKKIYSALVDRLQSQPELKRIFKHIARERHVDASQPFDEKNFKVDYEVFSAYYTQLKNSHRKCGDDCPHLKRFYQKVGYFPFHSSRPYLLLTKTDIDKLPIIKKRGYPLVKNNKTIDQIIMN